MVTGKTHVACGIIAAIIYQRYMNTSDTVVLLSGAVLGSLLPDIDNMSTISEFIPILHKPWKWIHTSTNVIWKWMRRRKMKRSCKWVKWVNDLFDHRGISHSIFLFPLLTLILAPWIGVTFSIGLLIGILSHTLICDSVTGGSKLFAPIYNQRIGIQLFKSGGKVEQILFGLIWAGIVLMNSPIRLEAVIR